METENGKRKRKTETENGNRKQKRKTENSLGPKGGRGKVVGLTTQPPIHVWEAGMTPGDAEPDLHWFWSVLGTDQSIID